MYYQLNQILTLVVSCTHNAECGSVAGTTCICFLIVPIPVQCPARHWLIVNQRIFSLLFFAEPDTSTGAQSSHCCLLSRNHTGIQKVPKVSNFRCWSLYSLGHSNDCGCPLFDRYTCTHNIWLTPRGTQLLVCAEQNCKVEKVEIDQKLEWCC